MAFTAVAARNFLKDAFNDEELETFCFDYFPAVQKDFSARMSKGDKIQMLLRTCQEREGVQALFQAFQERLPDLYRKRFGDQPPPQQFETTFTLKDATSSIEISINALSANTERRIAHQTESIQYYRKFARGLLIAGMIVLVSMALPVKYPIALAVRGMIAGGGLFICSLSGLPLLAIGNCEKLIDRCQIFLTLLEGWKSQPVLDAEDRALINDWMKQAFQGVLKAELI